MKRDEPNEVETRLRKLAEHRPAEPAEADLRAMADRVWREVQAPQPARRPGLWWVVAPAIAVAGLALLWIKDAQPPVAGGGHVRVEPDAAVAAGTAAPVPADLTDEMRELEETLGEPATAGEMLLELDEAQLRELLDALQKEKRS